MAPGAVSGPAIATAQAVRLNPPGTQPASPDRQGVLCVGRDFGTNECTSYFVNPQTTTLTFRIFADCIEASGSGSCVHRRVVINPDQLDIRVGECLVPVAGGWEPDYNCDRIADRRS